mgnify:FL=1|jgi:hypothetical protein|tara:strand:- start:395 stop:841 length:447 start_codon:yes stop_codon:yes gene_type:complete
MSEVSKFAEAFRQKSIEQAESTEKAVASAFEKHENALLSALSESEQRTRDAIRAQSRSLQRTALKSWMAVAIPVIATLLIAAGALGAMGWYITGQINEIASHNATLERLEQEGGSIQLSYCGESRRLCAKIDEDAERYQNGYRILEGY